MSHFYKPIILFKLDCIRYQLIDTIIHEFKTESLSAFNKLNIISHL
jgi:hypothetical protein